MKNAMESKYAYSFFRVSKTDNIHASALKYRDLRLRALKTSPDSFASKYEIEAAFSDDDWIKQLTLADREVFICAASPSDANVTGTDSVEWVGQVSVRGPISQEDFTLPPESGQAEPKPDTEEERWQILSLFTLPDHRGNGLGGKLCQEALDYLQADRPVASIHVRLMVKPENHVTVKLYERLGFSTIGKCTLAEALKANGDGHLLPSDSSSAKYSSRTGLIMSREIHRS